MCLSGGKDPAKPSASSAVGSCPAGATGPFDSADAAAMAALTAANPQSKRDNLEYSGLIYRGADGKYYYTGPAQGTDQGANPLRDAPAPAGTQVVADYHTHGDYSTADPVTGAAVRTNNPSKDQLDRKSTRLNSSHSRASRMPSSA